MEDLKDPDMIMGLRCTCIAINHDHVGKCDRKPLIRYGICGECKYYQHK